MHVDVKLFGVVVWEHMIADEAEQRAVWYLDILYSFSFLYSAQSQYFGNIKLLLLNIVLTPKRLSVELISTLKCHK